MTAADRAYLAERLVVEVGTAFQQRSVYPSEHPQVRRSLERAIAALGAWCRSQLADEVSIILLDDQLLVDREPLPEDSLWRRGLVQALARHRLSGLTLAAGLTESELGAFLDGCLSSTGAQATRHLQFGRSAFFDAGGGGGDDADAAAEGAARAGEVAAERVASAHGELLAAASGAATRLDHLRQLVARLGRVAAGARPETLALAGVEGADRAFLHGLAVSVGTLRLGRALGLAGDALEELGLAGLVHDLGYLEASPPAESSAERRRLHTVRGAARLAGIDGVPETVVVATHEHHLRFDGSASYPLLASARRPHAAARILAVADTWVTLREQAAVTASEAAAILRERAGSFLDPELVELFLAGLPV
ncbi:MAG: HD domain-containing protein [Thermoanaerobaculia bacterium]